MKGILFTPAMAAAACAGRKTVTRRVMIQPPFGCEYLMNGAGTHALCRSIDRPEVWVMPTGTSTDHRLKCDYQPGERRCLLTTWAVAPTYDRFKPRNLPVDQLAPFHALSETRPQIWHAGMGPKPAAGKSRPGRFLPNSLRHLMPVVEIVSVRVERVRAITEADAKAEGGPDVLGFVDDDKREMGFMTYRAWFASLWDSINAARGFGWAENPWVWAVTFRRVDA